MNTAIFKKELRSIIRERTFITTVIMQVFLIIFYTLAILGVYIIMNPYGSFGRIDLVIVENEFTDYAIGDFLPEASVKFGSRADVPEADIALEFISDDPAIIYVYAQGKGFRTSYQISELKKGLARYEEYKRMQVADLVPATQLIDASGVSLSRLTISALVFEFKYLLLIPLLLFLPIYLSGVLFIDLFTEEHAKKTLQLLRHAPLSMQSIINQKMAAALLLSIVQIVTWLGLLHLRNITVQNPFSIVLLCFLFNILVLLASAWIAVYFQNRSISQVIFSFAVIILLVTKSFAWSQLNIMTRLAISGAPIAMYAAILIMASMIMYAIVRYTAKLKYEA